MPVEFDLQIIYPAKDLPAIEQFEAWINACFMAHEPAAEICMRIVDETESQRLNVEYCGKDKPTNVLSFPYELPDGTLIGDLVMCAPVITKEAEDLGINPINHWAHLTVHGCLHILGFDHEVTAEAEIMEAKEADILKQLGYPNPYQGSILHHE